MKLTGILTTVIVALALTACGSDGNDAIENEVTSAVEKAKKRAGDIEFMIGYASQAYKGKDSPVICLFEMDLLDAACFHQSEIDTSQLSIEVQEVDSVFTFAHSHRIENGELIFGSFGYGFLETDKERRVGQCTLSHFGGIAAKTCSIGIIPEQCTVHPTTPYGYQLSDFDFMGGGIPLELFNNHELEVIHKRIEASEQERAEVESYEANAESEDLAYLQSKGYESYQDCMSAVAEVNKLNQLKSQMQAYADKAGMSLGAYLEYMAEQERLRQEQRKEREAYKYYSTMK